MVDKIKKYYINVFLIIKNYVTFLIPYEIKKYSLQSLLILSIFYIRYTDDTKEYGIIIETIGSYL